MSLELQHVGFSYPQSDLKVFTDLSLMVQPGERLGIIAPSGTGKTTAAKVMAGYYCPHQGRILLDGKPIKGSGPHPIQLIFQRPDEAVNPRWTVRMVLAEVGKTREGLLHSLGIKLLWLDRAVHELSGGELQRVCVARTLLMEPRFIVADEITTMLDNISQAQIWSVILNEVRRRKIGLVVMTHLPELRERICTRMVALKDVCHGSTLCRSTP